MNGVGSTLMSGSSEKMDTVPLEWKKDTDKYLTQTDFSS